MAPQDAHQDNRRGHNTIVLQRVYWLKTDNKMGLEAEEGSSAERKT